MLLRFAPTLFDLPRKLLDLLRTSPSRLCVSFDFLVGPIPIFPKTRRFCSAPAVHALILLAADKLSSRKAASSERRRSLSTSAWSPTSPFSRRNNDCDLCDRCRFVMFASSVVDLGQKPHRSTASRRPSRLYAIRGASSGCLPQNPSRSTPSLLRRQKLRSKSPVSGRSSLNPKT